MNKLFVIALAILIYLTISELSAKQKAEKFCNSVNIGDSTNNLFKAAIDAGARRSGTYWIEQNSQRSLDAAFTGFYPGSDFICRIDIAGNAVTAKHPSLVTSLISEWFQ